VKAFDREQKRAEEIRREQELITGETRRSIIYASALSL
jgi:hypothetical protein